MAEAGPTEVAEVADRKKWPTERLFGHRHTNIKFATFRKQRVLES